jgi:CSLREA domain-containing protein
MPRLLPPVAAALLVLGAAASQPASAADVVLRVDSIADAVDGNPGDGACRTDAGTCTLRAAVQEANARRGPHTVLVPAGRFVLTGTAFPNRGALEENDAGNGDLDLSDEIVIRGAGARRTIVDANGTDRVFSNYHLNNATLTDLTIRGGRNDGTASGGGVWNLGHLVLERVHVFDNEGAYGGGIFSIPRTHLVVRDSLVSGNRSGEGGGMRVDSGAEIINSTITGNSLFEVDQTRRPNEFSGYGGGIDHKGGADLVIVNSTITGNAALKGGGGLNSTFSYTPADGLPVLGRVVLRNSVIAGNRSAAGSAECRNVQTEIFSAGGVLDGDGSCGTTGPTDLPKRRAGLGPLRDNGGQTDTQLPSATSPLRRAGTRDGCPAADQRGVARRGGCDIGAAQR